MSVSLGQKTPLYWIDGRLTPANQASVPVTDLMVTRGYAAFESVRTYSGIPYLLDQHLDRFRRTCSLLHLPLRDSNRRIASIVYATLAANDFAESLVRIYLSGGSASGFVPGSGQCLMVFVDPLKPFPGRQYMEGIAVATSRLARMLPEAKSTDYMAGVHATIEARAAGYDEAVFVDRRDAILEGTTFSVFAVMARSLVTPDRGILWGVTARQVVHLAERAGLHVGFKPVTRTLLARCREFFITSSNRELIPVCRVDQLRIGDGVPGPLTRRLHSLYLESAEAYCSSRAAKRKVSGRH